MLITLSGSPQREKLHFIYEKEIHFKIRLL